jgi:hypothetical protein
MPRYPLPLVGALLAIAAAPAVAGLFGLGPPGAATARVETTPPPLPVGPTTRELAALLDVDEVDDLVTRLEEGLADAWERYGRVRAMIERVSVEGAGPFQEGRARPRRRAFDMTISDEAEAGNAKRRMKEIQEGLAEADRRIEALTAPLVVPGIAPEVAAAVRARGGALAAAIVRYDTLVDWTTRVRIHQVRRWRIDNRTKFGAPPARTWDLAALAPYLAPEVSIGTPPPADDVLARGLARAEEQLAWLTEYPGARFDRARGEIKIRGLEGRHRETYLAAARELATRAIELKAGLAQRRVMAAAGALAPAASLEERFRALAAQLDDLRIIDDRPWARDRTLAYVLVPPPTYPGPDPALDFASRWMPPRGQPGKVSTD